MATFSDPLGDTCYIQLDTPERNEDETYFVASFGGPGHDCYGLMTGQSRFVDEVTALTEGVGDLAEDKATGCHRDAFRHVRSKLPRRNVRVDERAAEFEPLVDRGFP